MFLLKFDLYSSYLKKKKESKPDMLQYLLLFIVEKNLNL